MKNIIKIKRIILIILIVINCSTIFYFSNQASNSSKSQSSRVVEFISNILPGIKNMQEPDKTILKKQVLTPIVRKTAHLSIYAMLGLLTYCFANTYELDFKKKILYCLLFCMCYAITDEIHQVFIEGRSGELRDVLIDSFGSLIGILFINLIIKIFNKIRNKTRKEKLVNG